MVDRSTRGGRARTLGAVLALVLGATSLAVGAATPTVAAAPATRLGPTPTPARVGRPTSMAAIGDSITQATGTGQISVENPKNSWATGWEVNSVRARLGISTANSQNLSANGARMGGADTQVLNGREGQQPLRGGTQYVVLEMGGNDLCRDSVNDMTPTATYRTQLREFLEAVRTRSPEALVFVMSVPDIYNLWYIRGAPQHATLHPEPQSDQASGLNGARFYWSQSFFPCRSLLANPDSWAQADRDRRAAVRQRTKEYNAALRAECAQWLRCRYDGDRLFNLTSNRVTPPDGPLKPHSQWSFTDADISRNEGAGRYLCPVQGVVAGGCGDHFHPSKAGQVKLADSAMAASYQFSDATAPTATATPSPGPRPDGTYRGPVTVTFGGADAAGIRGQEVRVHRSDGTVTPWSQSIGIHPPISVSGIGYNYVEVRSLDNNGNQSASTIRELRITTTAPAEVGVPTLTYGAEGLRATWELPLDDGGSPIVGYDLEVGDPVSVPRVQRVTGTSAIVDARPGRAVRMRIRAVSERGEGEWSPTTAWVLPPYLELGGFVDRMYRDMALRSPTSTELADGISDITVWGRRPAEVAVDRYLEPTWSGTLDPVVRLYRAYFLRLPDGPGLAYWEEQARGGRSHRWMSDFFAKSNEFRTRYGNLGNREFVRRVYQNVLEREPDAVGWDFWTNELDSGRYSPGRMMAYYSESAEYRNRTARIVAPVTLWWGLLDRLPTGVEHQQAVTDLGKGRSVADLADDLLATDEWVAHVS